MVCFERRMAWVPVHTRATAPEPARPIRAIPLFGVVAAYGSCTRAQPERTAGEPQRFKRRIL